MTKTEEILKKHLVDHAINGDVIKAAKQTALNFTKWKDENYRKANTSLVSDIHYHPIDLPYDVRNLKSLDQLFEEWNNLK